MFPLNLPFFFNYNFHIKTVQPNKNRTIAYTEGQQLSCTYTYKEKRELCERDILMF